MPAPQVSSEQFAGTLTRQSWTAQRVKKAEQQTQKPAPPNDLNILLALLSCVLCPLLGWLAVISAFEARIAYYNGNYEDAEALNYRARGTAFYSIAIGVGLGIGFGILFGLGDRYGWF